MGSGPSLESKCLHGSGLKQQTMTTEQTKICTKCKSEKSLNKFYKHPNGTMGRDSKCKECVKSYARGRRLDPLVSARLNEYDRSRRKTPEARQKDRERHRAKSLERKKLRDIEPPKTHKICPYCKEEKALNLFYNCKRSSTGASTYCKKCTNKKNRTWRENNPDKVAANAAAWLEKNKEHVQERTKNYRKANKKLIAATNKRRYEAKKEEISKRTKIYREENKERIAASKAKWAMENIETTREMRERYRKKKSKEPKYKIDHAVSVSIRKSIKRGSKGGRKWCELVGYDTERLMMHLESKFKPGMNWDNYGPLGWHIDHIKPKSLFKYETPDDPEFKQCWSLSNLQPLWFRENAAKKDKWIPKHTPTTPPQKGPLP